MTFKVRKTTFAESDNSLVAQLDKRHSEIVDVIVEDPNDKTNLITYKKILKA